MQQKQPLEVLYKKGIFKKFHKIHRNSRKNTCARASNLRVNLKRLWYRCFLVNFEKYLRKPFLHIEHLGRYQIQVFCHFLPSSEQINDLLKIIEDDILSFIKSRNSNKLHVWDKLSIKMIKICNKSILLRCSSGVLEKAVQWQFPPGQLPPVKFPRTITPTTFPCISTTETLRNE